MTVVLPEGVVHWHDAQRLVLNAIKLSRPVSFFEGYLIARQGSPVITSIRYLCRDGECLLEHLAAKAFHERDLGWYKIRIIGLDYSRNGYSYAFTDWSLDGKPLGSWERGEYRAAIGAGSSAPGGP